MKRGAQTKPLVQAFVGKAAACELAIKPCACFSVHCHRPRESVPDKESRDATDYALPQPTPLIVGN